MIDEIKNDLGFNRSAVSGVEKPPKATLDTRPSKGLASGLKRIGGRKGTLRLGRENRAGISATKRGRPFVSHKY